MNKLNLNINIKYEALLKNRITLDEYIALLSVILNVDINHGFKSLIEKGYISRYGNINRSGFSITGEGNSLAEVVQSMSSIDSEMVDKSNVIAKRLKELYPKGKKEGTNYYWADGVSLIAKRLIVFFRKYGDKYSEDQIVDATKRYIESFNGNYTFMKLLKYFIFKEGVGAGGDVESTSDLLTFIENKDEAGLAISRDFGELR